MYVFKSPNTLLKNSIRLVGDQIILDVNTKIWIIDYFHKEVYIGDMINIEYKSFKALWLI